MLRTFRIILAVAIASPSVVFAQGAKVPFTSYEVEAGMLGGGAGVRALAAPATTNWSSPELEASGRAFVELKATGDSVTLANNTGATVTALDIRYSIPDAPQGGGITATLNLYVDGVFRQSLPLSSKQIWLYAGTTWDGMSQDPTVGHPHIFFEEAHAWIAGAAVAPGSRITLQKDAMNTASFYWLDVMDLEGPPPAIAQSANSLSIMDYGAVPTQPADGPIPVGAVDSTQAIQNAINAAVAQGKSVWIPPGRFVVVGSLTASGVTIEGAGTWYSSVYRNLPLPVTTNVGPMWNVNSVTMRNFFVDSNATSRAQADGDFAGINISGANWLVEKMWIQHTSSGVWAKGSNGTVRDCRVLNTWGDGVNLNNGNHGGTGNNLTAENNYVRGVGDDGVTINSDVTSTQMDTVTLRNNTTVSVYWADGLRVAGGKNVLVENNLLCDPVSFPGIIIGVFNGANLESGIVRGNVIVRGGGDAYNQHKAALEVGTGAPGTVYVANVQITGNTIFNSMQKAIEVSSSNAIVFTGNVVDGLWINPASSSADVSAVDITANAGGSGTFNNNTLQDLTAGLTAFVNLAPSSSYQISSKGNMGFNPLVPGPTPWQGGTDGGATTVVASCTTPVTQMPMPVDLGGQAPMDMAGQPPTGGGGHAPMDMGGHPPSNNGHGGSKGSHGCAIESDGACSFPSALVVLAALALALRRRRQRG